ncbi:ABC transporter ATP-binding protein [Embleya sp. NBC_00896]|uniref:ABC transporter ATP-binding protein n=1 Tax=Embleya sp. NBC_00896 TaxID=2975961 RepID=UPI002F91A469|nr:ABC transporter ATP-binding protein [Embleya sp. NBC_00896]
MLPALLRMEGVGRHYGDRPVLDSVSVSVAAGRCVAVTGDNGSGKSTLLRLAVGREQPTSGAVWFQGAPVDAADLATRARIATVMDAGAYDPDLTVREHVLLAAVAHGLGADADEAVDDVLAEHRLTDRADAFPDLVSAGQVQAMLLAAAFVRPHALLVLDEPERRLDARARKELIERLVAHKRRGAAILLTTHHEALARAVADRILDLDDESPTSTRSPA